MEDFGGGPIDPPLSSSQIWSEGGGQLVGFILIDVFSECFGVMCDCPASFNGFHRASFEESHVEVGYLESMEVGFESTDP